MKKIILFACAALLTLASCGNKSAQNAEGTDTAVVDASALTVATEAITSLQEGLASGDVETIKTNFAKLQTIYAELVKSGKLEEAKTYASKVQQFITDNQETIDKVVKGETSIVELINGVKNLPINAEATADAALAAVQADAKAIVEGTVANAEEAAKTAVEGAVNEAKAAAVEKAKEAVAPAAQKVTEAAQKAAETKAKVDEKAAQAKAVNDAAKALLGK